MKKNKSPKNTTVNIEALLHNMKEISSGAYSKVYRAELTDRVKNQKGSTITTIALKIAIAEEDRECLFNEANIYLKIAKGCKHHPEYQLAQACITDFYGFREDTIRGTLYIEFANNGSLYDLLHENNIKLKCKTYYPMMREIMTGIDLLHKLGIYHRDLKPSNILLNEGHCKLADFGLSIEKNMIKPFAAPIGSRLYRAPELLRDYNPSLHKEKADIYAAGLIFWEMATGIVPYENDEDKIRNEHILVKRVGHGGHRPNISNKIPKKVAHLIRWFWHQDENTRAFADQALEELNKKNMKVSARIAKF